MMIKIKTLLTLGLFIVVACNNNKEDAVQQSRDTTILENPVTVVQEESNFLIKPNEFYGVKLTANIAELAAQYPKRFVKSVKKTGEGDFVVYKIQSDAGAHVANIYPNPQNENLVGQIEIISSKAKSQEGLGIGNSFKDLTDKTGEIEAHGSEIEGRTYASKNGIYYRLDMNHFTYDLNTRDIKPNTKIIEIVLR